MQISEAKYRLGEFIIIEHGSVLLTWVTHVALGTQRSGKCLIIGNILVIGDWEHEEAGYLKLEFRAHLMKLPAWKKTRYYSFASSLRKIGTKQGLTSNLIEQLSIDKIHIGAVNITGPCTFRLRRYEITVDKNSIISWQTIGELNRTICGTCFTESGILFICPKEDEFNEGQSKQQFFNRLKLLPQWNKTFAWGHYGSLMICNEPETRKPYAANLKSRYLRPYITNNMPFSQRQEFRNKRISEFKAPAFEWLKMAWHRVVEWKFWGRLTPLIKAGIFVGFRIFMFVVGEIVYLSRRITEHFREHRKK
ncbi:MAG: hypothetical protein L6406_17750 [Desulfobacterales bacterium]|nr:hypothetical protein [Desulfobacterales bacterium]